MTTISERATATIQQPGIGHNRPPKSQRVCCPACEFEFDLHKNSKPRSIEQHRRLFGLIKAAFFHWPENHERQFADAGELRSFLIMKAGWKEVALRMPVVGMKLDLVTVIVGAVMKAVHAHAIVVPHNNQLVIIKPKSIKFQSMKHLEFCSLNDAIDGVIQEVFSMTGDQLLQQHKGTM